MSFQSDNNETNLPVPEQVPVPEQENPAPVIDAEIKVSVQDTGLTACIRIVPPLNGGAEVTMDALMKVLVNENGIKNINLLKLKALVANPVYYEDIVVAVGATSIPGENGTFEFVDRKENKGKPKEIENGMVDYYDLSLIQNVSVGQVLCIITPPTLGTNGYTVKGDVIKAIPGKVASIAAGVNTALSADGTQIISKIDGQFEYDGKRVTVNETYTLNQDVDTSTGNIKVAGNLVVRGMVTSGFKIEAGGFINVVGVVDSGTVIANKDVNLQGGANGSTINCGGNFKCRFIENCDVFVSGEMKAEYILNSNVRCKKSLKTEGTISKIIGGTCIVMQNVESRTIGSAAGTKTKIEIGSDPEIVERQRALSEQIPELEKQLKNLEPLLKLLNQLKVTNRLDDEKAQTLEKASFSFKTQSAMLDSAKRELEDLSTSIFNKNFGKVICTGIIYPGTTVTIGSANFIVTQNLMNTSMFYNEGEVSFGSAR